MRTKRILASLLALLMLFTLMPTLALAEDAEDEAEIIIVEEEPEIPEDEEPVEGEEPEALPEPEPEADEPEADPVEYDLWVCGVQVTDSNKSNIVAGVSFNPTTATLSVNGNAANSFTNPELTNGAVIYSELPELIINSTTGINMKSDTAEKLIYVNGGDLTLKAGTTSVQAFSSDSAYYGILVEGGNLTVDCYLQITAPEAEYGIFVNGGDLLLDKVTINYSTGPKDMVPVVLLYGMQNGVGIANGTVGGTTGLQRSTVKVNGVNTSFSSPTIQGDTVVNAMVTTEDESLSFTGKLRVYTKAALFGVYVPNGSLNNQADLDVSLNAVDDGCAIYAATGLTSSGPLSADNYEGDDGYGIKVMDGDVNVTCSVLYLEARHCGLYVGNGNVNISGVASFGIGIAGATDGLCPSSGLFAGNGEVTIGGISMFGGASYTVFANGPVHVTGDLEFENVENLLGGAGIKSTTGGIVIDGSATITATVCLDSGDGTEGILIKGDATLNPTGRHAATAPNGPITVQGNLNARDAMHCAVTAKGDIKVEGNAYVTASSHGYDDFPGVPMESTDGSITITGDLSCYGTKNPCYAKNDIRVGGNALFSGAGDYGVKAENGEITVSGTLTCKGDAAYSVWAGTSVTVEKDVTITNAAEDSVGMYAAGFLQFVSGKWDVDAGAAALQAGNGIEIPEGYGVTLPEGGKVAVVDSLNTITEADGTTVAAHAIIEEKEEALITVTFDAGEGTVEPATVEVNVGGSIETLPEPVLEGWKFLGWFTEPMESYLLAGQGTQVTAETSFDEDATVYAHWRLPGDINGDGKVNNKDVTRLQKYLNGDEVEVMTFNLDTNGDGRVSNKDLTRLQRFVKGAAVEVF
ncbi:MAG: InlB B-repeat-containing protein [Oscillospiraceae bacterium]|nr:InlB B-repeat-containing protein [Oscillospiraceae bacterium]